MGEGLTSCAAQGWLPTSNCFRPHDGASLAQPPGLERSVRCSCSLSPQHTPLRRRSSHEATELLLAPLSWLIGHYGVHLPRCEAARDILRTATPSPGSGRVISPRARRHPSPTDCRGFADCRTRGVGHRSTSKEAAYCSTAVRGTMPTYTEYVPCSSYSRAGRTIY